MIEAGWGDWSATWSSWVQPEAARTTRVCTYDRAGMGFSEPGPLPRTAERFAQELHTLLQRRGHPRPVRAGRALAGRADGALVRARVPGRSGRGGADRLDAPRAQPGHRTATRRAVHLGVRVSDWILTLPARIGVLRLLRGPLGLSAGFSPEVADAYVALSVTPRYLQTYLLDEGRGCPASLAQAGLSRASGDCP